MSVPGDLNHDGKLDAQDLAFLRQLLTDHPDMLQHLSEQERNLLDLNHDGVIDREDLTLLCAKIINQPQASANIQNKLTSLRDKLGH